MLDDQNVGGKGTEFGSLDLTSKADVMMLNEAMRRRPKQFRKMDDDLKDEMTDALRESIRVSRQAISDPEKSLLACDLTGRLVMVGVRMNADNMKDDHHAIDAARGKGENRTENKIVVIQAPSARTMGELRKLAEKQEGGT